jgi:hypothetical protein
MVIPPSPEGVGGQATQPPDAKESPMRAWMVMSAAMLVGVGVGVPGTDRVVPLPVYAAEQAADQAVKVLADMRAALGGPKLEQVKAVSVEGPFRREMGPRQIAGTAVMVLQGPDKMHRSEDTEFPGGMSVERITAVSGATSWEDTQNRGGMGGGMQVMMRGPGGAEMNEEAREKMRTTRLTAEMQRWMFALLAAPAGDVTYAGVAESPDGKADMLEMKDVRGQALRLFVDQQTHLPLMLSFQDVRPRMMIQGGPGGRRSGGGAGGRGPGGPPPADPHAAPAPAAPQAGPAGGQRPSEEEIRRRIESMPPPTPSAVQVSLADYTTVDGVKFPKLVSVTVDGKPSEEWTLEKIKVNPSLKADFFDKK